MLNKEELLQKKDELNQKKTQLNQNLNRTVRVMQELDDRLLRQQEAYNVFNAELIRTNNEIERVESQLERANKEAEKEKSET